MTVTSAPARATPRQTPQAAPRNLTRLLWVELRHNAMPLVLPLIAVLFWFDGYRIAATLPPMWVWRLFYILGQGHALIDFAPFVAGVAAWMGSRDGRRGMGDLVTATVRPRWEAQLATWAATVIWAVGSYLVFMAVVLYLLGRSIAWGGLPWWPIAVDGVGVAAFASVGFAAGARFPSRFTPPLVAFGAVLALGMSSQTGFAASSGWALILPTMSNGNFGQDAGIFYQFLPDLPIARVMFLAGIAVAAVALLGLPVTAGGQRLRRVAAVLAVAGAASAVAGVVLATAAHVGPYVVAAMTAAAPASVISGNITCAACPPDTLQCQCSAAQSSAPSPASSASATGARRLTRYSRASRSQAGPVRAAGAGTAPGAARCTPAAVMAAAPGRAGRPAARPGGWRARRAGRRPAARQAAPPLPPRAEGSGSSRAALRR